MEQLYITYVLIGITVLVSFSGYNNPTLIRQLIMNPYQISRQHQYYRFITSGFIHQDHMHLLFNMISLFFFGVAVEQVFASVFDSLGTMYFLILYLVGIVVSDIPTYFKHRNHPQYNALGASGGTSAVIFAFIIFLPLQDICLYYVFCFPGFILGTAYLIFSWYQGRKANDNINHDAHLYGALFGLVFCAVLYPPCIPNFFVQISEWPFLQRLLG